MPDPLLESRSVRYALRHFWASTGIDVDAEAFATALRVGRPLPGTSLALETHLNEADPAELANLVIEGVASFESLHTLSARFLREGHPNRVYLARCLP